MADGPAGPSFLSPIARMPGPTPDTEYIRSPSDGAWIQVQKLSAPWQPPPSAPAAPEPPSLMDRALAHVKTFGEHAVGQISDAEALHENALASAQRYMNANPQSPLTQAAQGVQSMIPGGSLMGPIMQAMANRKALIAETPQEEAENTQPGGQTLEQGVQAFKQHPVQSTVGFLGDTARGLKALGVEALNDPGAATGKLIQSTVTHPELLIGGDAGIAARAALTAERVARVAGAGERAARTAALMGDMASKATGFGALSAGSEALHEAGDGAVDPSRVVQAFGEGAAIAPFGDILNRSMQKPTVRQIIEQLKTGLDKGPEAPAGTPAIGGPPSGGPEAGGGAPASSVSSKPLSEVFKEAGAAGVDPEALRPIASDRLRGNISEADARAAVQDLIDKAVQPTGDTVDQLPELNNPAYKLWPKGEASGGTPTQPAAESATPPEEKAVTAAGENPTSEPPKNDTEATQPLEQPKPADIVSSSQPESAAEAPAEKAPPAGMQSADEEAPVGQGAEPATAGEPAPAPKPDENGLVHTEVAGQPVTVNVEPTELQKASGSYQKGHVTVHGIPITIENPAGTTRTGVGDDGKPWTSTLSHDYGYIKRSIGGDGEHVDTFIGPNPESQRVYVVDQKNVKTGDWDESKVMLGFDTRDEANEAYLANYPKNWSGRGKITPATIDQFKAWLKDGNTRQPFSEATLPKPSAAERVREAKPPDETIPAPTETNVRLSAPAAEEPAPIAAPLKTSAAPTLEAQPQPAPARPAVSAPKDRYPLSADAVERLKDPAIQEEMRRMAGRAGWAEEGGHMLRKMEDVSSPDHKVVTGRTSWVPYEPWFKEAPARLGKNDRAYPAVVQDAIAGKPLKAKESRAVEHMTEVAERSLKGETSEDDLAAEAAARSTHGTAAEFEDQKAHDEYEQHLRQLVEQDHEREREIDAIAEREARADAEGSSAGREASEVDQADVRGSAATPEREGGEASAVIAPAEKGGDRDLLGDDTRAAQRVANEIRRRDTARNTGQDSLETGRADDLFSQARNQTDLVDQAARTTFTTSKGSTYEVTPRGTTIRNKAARPEHPGDSGPQPESDSTFYVTSDDANKLGEFQAEGAKKSIRLRGEQAGVHYEDGPSAGKFERRTMVNVRRQPAVGLMPVETWKNGARVHFGNAITSVRHDAGAPAPTADSTARKAADAVWDQARESHLSELAAAEADKAPPAAKPKTPRETIKQRKAREFERARSSTFTPGNIVKGYGNTFDRVIAYHPPQGDERWSVDVREVKKVGDKFEDIPGERVRNHATHTPPSAVVYRAPGAEEPPPKTAQFARRPTLSLKDRTKPEVASYLHRVGDALKGHARIQVHATPQEFGDTIDQEVPRDVYGAYTDDDQTLHFIASNLPDVATAQRILRHEAFGHLAMEKSPDFAKALAMVDKLRRVGGQRLRELASETRRDYPDVDDSTLNKEMIARMAERGIKNAILDRAITGVHSVLRKLGIHTEPTAAEIRTMIMQAARGLPEEALKLSGLDRQAAFDIERLVSQGKLGDAQDAFDQVLPESEALDALSYAKRHGDAQAVQLLKDISRDVPGDADAGEPEPDEADAYHPVEASIPRGILFARHAPLDPAAAAARKKVMDPDGRDDLTIRDRMRLGLQALRNVDAVAMRQYWIDDLASLENYERRFLGQGKLLPGETSPLKAARSVRNLASQMAAVLEKGIPDYRQGALHAVPGRIGFKKLFEPLHNHPDGSLVKHWELYAAARRASRLINETNKDGTVREKNFTQAEIDAGLDLAKKYPQLKQVFDDLQTAWKQLLDLGESAGTINPEARKIYEKHDYVPFYRAEEEFSGARARGGLANQREMSGRLTGKAAPLRNILENVMMNIANQIDAAQKNLATQKVVDTFTGTFAIKVPKQAEAVKIDNKQVRAAMTKLGIDLDPNMTPAQLAQWTTFFQRVAPTDKDVIRVMRAGKPEYWRITDPLVLDSLTAIQGSPEWLRRMDKYGILSGPKRLLTATATATPAYTARRFLRVLMDTWLQSNEKLWLVKNAYIDFYDAMNGHKDLYDMMMAGSGGAQGYDADPERVRKQMIEAYAGGNKTNFIANAASPKRWWKLWRQIQNASKNEHMLRVYRAARAKGASVAEAAFKARDIEDLSMHGGGAIAQFINRSVPFINARVQGTARMVRGFKENWRAYALRGAMVTMGSLALQAYNWDNPKYQQLPQWEKDLGWHVFIGDHHFILPKPFELGLIFGTLPERLVAAGMHQLGKGGDTVSESADAAKRALLDTFALNPIPQFARPLLEQATNTDAMGRTIVTDQEQKVDPQEQYGPYTSPTIRMLASSLPGRFNYVLNSPARLQALVESVTSSVGMTIIDGADRLTRHGVGYGDAPSSSMMESAFKSFHQYGEPTTTKYTAELYDFRDQADKTYDTMMKMSSEGRVKEAQKYFTSKREMIARRGELNDLGKEMKLLQKMIVHVSENPNLSADAKAAEIEKLTKARNDIARRVAPLEDFF